jgi:hypothetical protein
VVFIHFPCSTPQKTDPLPKIQNETQHDIIRTSSQPYLVSLRFGAVAVSIANVFQNRRIRPSSTPRGFCLSRCVDLSSTGVGVHLLGDLLAFVPASMFRVYVRLHVGERI